jgi:hypothetical protein
MSMWHTSEDHGWRASICRGLLMVALLGLVACAREGLVLEKGTKKPLVGAFVIAQWNTSANLIVETRSGCDASQVTQTDANGHFQFPRPLNPFRLMKAPTIYAYTPSYEVFMQMADGEPILLEPLKGKNSEKFVAVSGAPFGAFCDGNQDNKSFIPVRKTRLLELQRLAQTPEELRIVDAETYGIDFLEFGESVAVANQRKRDAVRLRSGAGESRL